MRARSILGPKGRFVKEGADDDSMTMAVTLEDQLQLELIIALSI